MSTFEDSVGFLLVLPALLSMGDKNGGDIEWRDSGGKLTGDSV